MTRVQPDRECAYCPRLAGYRAASRRDNPGWHNAPVPSFGNIGAQLLIVGLAPGLKGANRTGRPFTGDAAGELLYPTLVKFGLAQGSFGAAIDDGLQLIDCRITNAVRCVPPENKVTAAETKACAPFLGDEIAAMENLAAVLALGVVAHGAVLAALGLRKSARKFSHGAMHELDGGPVLTDSYHCSRYNTNTGRLTTPMFEEVFEGILKLL